MTEAKFEYELVRLEGTMREERRQVVREHAEQEQRLSQMLAPGSGGLWASPDTMEALLEHQTR